MAAISAFDGMRTVRLGVTVEKSGHVIGNLQRRSIRSDLRYGTIPSEGRKRLNQLVKGRFTRRV